MEKPEIFKVFNEWDTDAKRRAASSLFHCVAKAHASDYAMGSFTWKDAYVDNEGNLLIKESKGVPLTEKSRQSNFRDYAGVLYCLCTGQTIDEPTCWDAEREVDDVVIREIILTFCGRNTLRGEDAPKFICAPESFVIERGECYQKRSENYSFVPSSLYIPEHTPWYQNVGKYIMMGIASSLLMYMFRACCG